MMSILARNLVIIDRILAKPQMILAKIFLFEFFPKILFPSLCSLIFIYFLKKSDTVKNTALYRLKIYLFGFTFLLMILGMTCGGSGRFIRGMIFLMGLEVIAIAWSKDEKILPVFDDRGGDSDSR